MGLDKWDQRFGNYVNWFSRMVQTLERVVFWEIDVHSSGLATAGYT